MNRELKTLILVFSFFMFSTSAYSKDYIVVCEAGRWEGNDLSTESSQNQIEIDKNGTYLGKYFWISRLQILWPSELPESEEYKGLITYFYDHTKYSSDQLHCVYFSTNSNTRKKHYTDSKWVGALDIQQTNEWFGWGLVVDSIICKNVSEWEIENL